MKQALTGLLVLVCALFLFSHSDSSGYSSKLISHAEHVELTDQAKKDLNDDASLVSSGHKNWIAVTDVAPSFTLTLSYYLNLHPPYLSQAPPV